MRGNAAEMALQIEDGISDQWRSRCSNISEGMLFSFEQIIEHVTKDDTLMPGEFIGSGTVGGGCGLEIGRYLEHDDTIELEIEKIGILRNKVERQG